MKKIKHNVVTQDYIAAEQIQDKNWKYFVESLLLSFSQNATDKEYQKSFLLDTQENLVILKKTYEKLYNQIAKQFNTTLNKMSFDLFKEIKDDFIRENHGVEDLTNLDNWVSFYFKHGRFPGNGDLTILPQAQLPKLIDQLSVEASPVELYKKIWKWRCRKSCFFPSSYCIIFILWWRRYNCKKSNGRMERKFNLSSFIKRK